MPEQILSAATVEVLDSQDKVITTGIVTGRTRKSLLAKARKFVQVIGKLTGQEYDSFTIVGDNGADLAEESNV